MSDVLFTVICLLLGGGCLGYMFGYNKGRENQFLDDVAKNKLLKERETANLLGPHAPEGGQTIIERLRQTGFTVLDKSTPPRAHMLGWLQIVPAPDNSYKAPCFFCGSKYYEIHEVVEDPDQPFSGALMVCLNFVCTICNCCGIIFIFSELIENCVGLKIRFCGILQLKH